MQTFLPYPDFAESAACLDSRRLGKQRVEATQILRTLRVGGGWSSHPAVRMWRGHESSLAVYQRCMMREWIWRGYRSTMEEPEFDDPVPPSWLGDLAFHESHRSNLLRKDPVWYGQFNWTCSPNLPYLWPDSVREP
jgi:hypothetical protein